MGTTILHRLLILFLSQPIFPSCKVGQLEGCLLDGKVFYKDTGQCERLLEQGPCDRGQQMVIGLHNQGTVSRHEKTLQMSAI